MNGKIEEENKVIVYDEIKTIKDVIEYHKSRYISENPSKEAGFYLDVYLKFKVPLYTENDESNEEYYNLLLEDSAKILRYQNFKMIDNEHKITIKIICSNGEISKIIINDIEDYFIYMDSKLSAKNYKELPITDFSVSSNVLQGCIDNNWDFDTYLGEKDSFFNNYNIYQDEGVEVKIINKKIFNIIFTKKYSGNVIDNIYPGVDLEYVEASLGEPTFKDENLNFIGYKGNNFYIFLTDEQISVYRNSSTNSDEFFDLTDKYINEELDLLEFMNQLTYMWPDYNEYYYTESSFFISYPLKGIEITVNNGDRNGFLVYNNNRSSLSKISRYLENTNFIVKLQIDSVFEAEKRRLEEKIELINSAKEYKKELDENSKKLIGESLYYNIKPIVDNNGYIYQIKFISLYDEKPNREINDSINSFLWATNDYFLFSKKGKGIYFYNLNTGRVQLVYEGNDNFDFVSYKDNLLKYDYKEIKLIF